MREQLSATAETDDDNGSYSIWCGGDHTPEAQLQTPRVDLNLSLHRSQSVDACSGHRNSNRRPGVIDIPDLNMDDAGPSTAPPALFIPPRLRMPACHANDTDGFDDSAHPRSFKHTDAHVLVTLKTHEIELATCKDSFANNVVTGGMSGSSQPWEAISAYAPDVAGGKGQKLLSSDVHRIGASDLGARVVLLLETPSPLKPKQSCWQSIRRVLACISRGKSSHRHHARESAELDVEDALPILRQVRCS